MAKKNEAVISLQKAVGSKADGIIGPKTMKAFQKTYLPGYQDWAVAYFFGQVAVETGGNFNIFTENLNYSATGLLRVFPKYFKTQEEAMQFAYNPEKIANRVYANRIGNGDEASGDGWRFRGRGAIQLTGRANYETFFKAFNLELTEEAIEEVATTYAFDCAIWYFTVNKIWKTANSGFSREICDKVTKAVNGAGASQSTKDIRWYYTKKFYQEMKGNIL